VADPPDLPKTGPQTALALLLAAEIMRDTIIAFALSILICVISFGLLDMFRDMPVLFFIMAFITIGSIFSTGLFGGLLLSELIKKERK
jgi:predicted exporter